MPDERWSEDVETVGDALRKLLATECTPERVRAAEGSSDGRDRALEEQLDAFGLTALDADAEMFARIAFELGRALAPCDLVETMPAVALLGRPGIALGFDGPVPASVVSVATRREDSVIVSSLSGMTRRASSGSGLLSRQRTAKGRLSAPRIWQVCSGVTRHLSKQRA